MFKSKYLAALKAKVKAGVEEDMEAIPTRRCSWPLILGELDKDIQKYICALSDAGAAISTSLTIAAAEGFVTAHDRTLLVQHGSHIELTRDWALLVESN